MELLARQPKAIKEKFMASLSDSDLIDLVHDPKVMGRPDQQLPTGDWHQVLFRAGRGWGKTWTGAHIVNNWAATPKTRICIVAANSKEIRDVIANGPSGILAQAHPDRRPEFTEGRNIIEWANGSIALLYSAETPEALRGPQFHYAWIDELFKFKYQEALYDQVLFSLRLGKHPQAIITSTPRPTDLQKLIAADPKTVIINGSTFDNRSLSTSYLDKIRDKFEGTRLGRQELFGEVLDDNPDSLFQWNDIDGPRILTRPKDLDRIVVAIDPAVTANENSDLTGIVACGKHLCTEKTPEQYYVLADATLKGSPQQWAQAAIDLYYRLDADCIVAEVNNGGDMIEAVIRGIDPNIPYKAVRATRGKVLRAEPVAALYEQEKVHHVGVLVDLEDQMIGYNPALGSAQKSPDRLDALVWAITELSGGEVADCHIWFV